MTDTKIELLKLAVELTDVFTSQNHHNLKNPQPKSFEDVFSACYKLVADTYNQEETDQNYANPSHGA